MTTEVKIDRVMMSNYLYTLFFDGAIQQNPDEAYTTNIEIPKTKFRGMSRPKAGDLFTITQEKDDDGKIVCKMFLNKKEIKGQPL